MLAYQPERSISERMAAALSSSGLQEALRVYRAFRADPRHAHVDTENEINNLGYQLLRAQKYDQAIAVLQVNAAEYPQSANVFDSLGEAYLLSGRREEAIRSYRKSLQLDPMNDNARAALQKLGG